MRTHDLAPRDCELCECQEHKWNGRNCMLRDDPPSTCECGHLTSQHRFRKQATVNGQILTDEQESRTDRG